MNKIKVLIVDDSAIVRNVLKEKLSESENIEVVGAAPDPYVARNMIVQLKPDVITLDIEMPRMDGLTFLSKLMSYYPIPVIIVSSVTTQDSSAAIKALEIGAFDIVNKPGSSISVQDVTAEIIYKIEMAYKVKDTYTARRDIIQKSLYSPKTNIKVDTTYLSSFKTTDFLIAIGSSTGGTLALEYIFQRLPQNMPPILVVQHMPAGFTKQFAMRLNDISQMTVKESEDGEIISSGTAYIAMGGYHMEADRVGGNLFIKHSLNDRVHFQRPAVDVLFRSLASSAGKNCAAALLTGMGKDGAEGLLKLKQNGAYTIAQDEDTSVVWGMPKAAIDINGQTEILSLDKIPFKLIELSK